MSRGSSLPRIFPRPRLVAADGPAMRAGACAEGIELPSGRRYAALKHDILRRILADLELIDCLERARRIDLRSQEMIDGRRGE